MKIFWSIILVLVIGAGAVAMLADGSRGEPRVDGAAEPADRSVARAAPETESAPAHEAPEARELAPEASEEDARPEVEAEPRPEPESEPASTEESASSSAPSEETTSEPASDAEAASSEAETEARTETDAVTEAAPVSDEADHSPPQRFAIEGEGTREKPYEVSWALLMSASDTYQPRLGRDEIPEQIKKLDGKRVRIRGHATFAMMANEPTEMLLMLNEWDGCCLGVPPTPYDAIEVTLNEPVRGRDRYLSRATVEGTFRVDPYLVGEWLVGLYVMEDVSLSNTQHGMGEQID